MFQTPKRKKLLHNSARSPDESPNSRVLKSKSQNCQDKGPVSGSPSLLSLPEKEGLSPLTPTEAKRGRPRAETLNSLILEGATSPSSIKCTYCHRVFPREKSLQAHLRTHTGEKPYVCDFPRCTRQFAQSGQLKTHQRLHTGEKPFVCSVPNCNRRFTHANRHCPDHPDAQVRRTVVKIEKTPEPKPGEDMKNYDYDAHNAEVREWLQNWDRRNKSSPNNENLDTTPKKSMFKNSEESVYSSGSSAYFSNNSLNGDLENSPKSEGNESSSFSNPDCEINLDVTPPRNSLCLKFPKKRWLSEAVQDKHIWDSNNDLAHPINWGDEVCSKNEEEECIKSEMGMYEEPLPLIKPKFDLNGDLVKLESSENENQNRPSVLVCVPGGKSKEMSNDEIEGAMALVELKNANFNYRI